MRSAPDLPHLAAQLAQDPAPGADDDRARAADDLAAAVSNAGMRAHRATDPEWLPDCKTATDELRRLSEAASHIRDARVVRRRLREDSRLDLTPRNEVDPWEHVVANAAREATRVSAQLAYFGLDIGSIAVVRRKAENNLFKALEIHFRDGHEVRSPCLIIAGYGDGSIHYGWLGRMPEPGRLDPARDFSPQMRRLLLRLCELVAHGYVNDAGFGAQISNVTPTAPRIAPAAGGPRRGGRQAA